MKQATLIFLLVCIGGGCASQHRLRSRPGGASVDMGGKRGDKVKGLTSWSYFWDQVESDIIIPDYLSLNLPHSLGEPVSLKGLTIHSYFTINDIFLALIPFVERRHFDIFYRHTDGGSEKRN